MKREEILAMEPGKELDALIAIKVMGWGVGSTQQYPGHPVLIKSISPPSECEGINPSHYMKEKMDFSLLHSEVTRYSTDISAAWEVVEKMREEAPPNRECFKKLMGGFSIFLIRPVNICKAALLAVLEEGETK